jgi:uncharacterized protein (TIGR00251 family)
MAACRIPVRLTPRASRDEILGFEGEVLRVRVKAAPVEGRANEALLRFLAEVLGLRRRQVRLVAGSRAREKVLAVEGLSQAELEHRLEAESARGSG